MNTYQAIETLLAVRQYQEQDVPEDVILRIVQAGRLTASSKNEQEWDFIVVRERDRLQQLGKMASTGSFIGQAAFAIAVLITDMAKGYADGGRATQDMMLAAWEQGVGSNWVGNVNTAAIRDFLGVPEGRTILNIIPFGYPVKELGKGRKDRKPLEQVVHSERYGQKFAD